MNKAGSMITKNSRVSSNMIFLMVLQRERFRGSPIGCAVLVRQAKEYYPIYTNSWTIHMIN